MANRYFHIRSGRESGPFTSKQLQDLARDGSISPEDLIRPEAGQRTYPARNVVGLFSPAPAKSAPSPAAPEKKPTPTPSTTRHAVVTHAPQVAAAAASQAARAPQPAAEKDRSPLAALMAALVDLQREELTRQVVRGERSAADAERRSAELIALLKSVEGQQQQQPAPVFSPGGFSTPSTGTRVADDAGGRVQLTAANTSPYFPAPQPPAPSGDGGLGTALGIGAAALIAGGAGIALGRAMASSPPPIPQRPAAPPEEPSSGPGLAQVSRTLWSATRPHHSSSPSPADIGHNPPHVDSGPQELSYQDLANNSDIPTADPIPEGEIVDSQPIEWDSSPASGLTWDDPVPDATAYSPPDEIPMAEPIESDGGGFFGNLFGNGGEGVESTEVAASDGGGGFFGGLFGESSEAVESTEVETGGWWGSGGDDVSVDDAGGLLDGGIDAGDVDLGGFDLGGIDF